MKHHFIRLLAAAGLLCMPAMALPAVQHITVGNVTSSGACVAWEFSEAARPGLEIFTDAAATQNVTTSVRVEIQALENSRREVSSTAATRSANRSLQSDMAAKNVAFVRLSGLAPDTDYYLRPQALADTSDTVLASGGITPLATARTTAFVPESRQLIADLAAMVPTTGAVSGSLLIASHAQAAYPLIAVVGDGAASTMAYFDLSLLLDAAGETSLLPSAGPLTLTLSWLGLPEIGGVFQPNTVAYTGTTVVAAATTTEFVGQGFIVHAAPEAPTAVAGIPFMLDLFVTDLAGVVQATFERPLIVESAALSTGAGSTPPLATGRLDDHLLLFSSAGTHTVVVRDSGSNSSTSFEVTVLPMNYQNWRNRYLGPNLVTGATWGNIDFDPFPNFIEFIHGTDPNAPDATLLGASRAPGKALTIHFTLNPLQRDYKVVIQVTPDLATYQPSAKIPQVIQTYPGFNLMEVSWTEAELQAETGVASPGYFARLAWEPATSFASWLDDYSLTGPTANPDNDNDPNFVEFALDSNPTSGASSGKVRQSLVDYGVGFAQVLTFPMRLGAVAPASDPAGGELIFDVDGLRYRIQGSGNLVAWTLDMVEVPAQITGLPPLSPGYEYRSFRGPGSTAYSFEFVRLRIDWMP